MNEPLPKQDSEPEAKPSNRNEGLVWGVILLILGSVAVVVFGYPLFAKQLKLRLQDNPSSFQSPHPVVEAIEDIRTFS